MSKIILFMSILFSSVILSNNNVVIVTDFLPNNYIKDGSVSYQAELQNVLDKATETKSTIIFPPMVYILNEKGLRVGSDLTLSMHGAVFNVSKDCKNDGYVFYGENVQNVKFIGGEIIGHNSLWKEGVNIRGIYLKGNVKNISCSELYIHDLSSNGIGIIGEPNNYAKDIWITDVIVDNCCNYYGDYMSEKPGPEKNSDRKDQGSVALYYCEDFIVSGSRFEKSRSDGTHFYKCNNGQFVNNKVYSSQMGGYFLETCIDVVATGNIIKDNGSRGTTIERGSIRCTLVNNIVASSGREGLWAPDCIGLVISNNIFDLNGRKPLGTKPNQKWNANITINEAHDPTKSPTIDYLIKDNIIYSDSSQHSAIYIDGNVSSNIIVKGNLLKGNNKLILVEGETINNIIIDENN